MQSNCIEIHAVSFCNQMQFIILQASVETILFLLFNRMSLISLTFFYQHCGVHTLLANYFIFLILKTLVRLIKRKFCKDMELDWPFENAHTQRLLLFFMNSLMPLCKLFPLSFNRATEIRMSFPNDDFQWVSSQ